MARVMHPEWRDAGRDTNYPFADSATLTNSSGRFLAEDTFLDLSLYAIGLQERAFLTRINVESDTITIYFGDAADKFRCSGSFSLVDPPANVALADAYGRPAGLIVSRSELLAQLQSLGLGTHDFTVAATEICATCVIPTPERGVRGFLLEDGTVVSGDVWLVGDDGIVLSHERTAENEETIRVDVVGDPLFRRLLCGAADLFSTPRVLTQLRVLQNCRLVAVLTPDARGDIQLIVGNHLASDTTLRIRPTSQGLKLEQAGA